MVPSRHRLRQTPQQRRPRHPLGRHIFQNRLNSTLPNRQNLPRILRLHQRKREPGDLLAELQDLSEDVCRGADVRVRDRAWMVLLDLEDGVGRAVEL